MEAFEGALMQAKEAIWNLHSIPRSMAEENCTCCMVDLSSITILGKATGFPVTALTALTRPHLPPGPISTNATKQACMWSAKQIVTPKLALYPASIFGAAFTRPLEAGFEAYLNLQSTLGSRMTWKNSP